VFGEEPGELGELGHGGGDDRQQHVPEGGFRVLELGGGDLLGAGGGVGFAGELPSAPADWSVMRARVA
jgi:hypothetical protein